MAANDKDTVVVGTNADVDALTSIVEGTGVTASVRQDPYTMGAQAVETAMACLEGKEVEKPTAGVYIRKEVEKMITIPVKVIDIEEAQETLDAVNAVLNADK